MRTKLLAAIATGGVLVTAGTAAAVFAATRSPGVMAVTTVAATGTTSSAVPWCQGPLAQLVTDGTISQDQANAVHDALAGYMSQHRLEFSRDATPPMLAANGPLAQVLPQLVKDGTITQAQADAVKAAITEQAQERWRDGYGPGRPGHRGGPGPGMMYGGPAGAAPGPVS